MSTTMMKGLQLRNLIRLRLQDVAEQLPGTVGFVIPDRFHLVYLEYARAATRSACTRALGSRHRGCDHGRGPCLYAPPSMPRSAMP